jgi:hypothetical protein
MDAKWGRELGLVIRVRKDKDEEGVKEVYIS